jgi:predicted nucleotidyltransferase
MRKLAVAHLLGVVAAGWLALGAALASGDASPEAILRFAAEVARKGDWREARFRWEQANRLDPDNPRILNNLAVASELLGAPDKARELYARAVELSDHEPLIVENAERSARFWHSGDGAAGASRFDASPGKKVRKKGSIQLTVRMPVPARLDLSRAKTLLVASFVGPESDLLDTHREIVRFLRGELRKRSDLDVLDVSPPPAVPEQRTEDLVANREFWKHLGREYGADVVLSGTLDFSRKDASGFEEVDLVSETTGQKVRRTLFVEREQFRFDVEVFFFDGAGGDLLFRDRFQRSFVFQGSANDPITAFYQLCETIAGDVRAVVSPHDREDVRIIFD